MEDNEIPDDLLNIWDLDDSEKEVVKSQKVKLFQNGENEIVIIEDENYKHDFESGFCTICGLSESDKKDENDRFCNDFSERDTQKFLKLMH